jgi:hypothetical protein
LTNEIFKNTTGENSFSVKLEILRTEIIINLNIENLNPFFIILVQD